MLCDPHDQSSYGEQVVLAPVTSRSSLLQMAKVRELVSEMATIQMEFGASFWSVLRPVQHARGLTATPHTVYDLNALGIEIGAVPQHSSFFCGHSLPHA